MAHRDGIQFSCHATLVHRPPALLAGTNEVIE